MNKEDVVHTHTHTQRNISHEKWNPAICDNMDGLIGYYAKRNKSEKEQIPYNFTSI